MMKINGKNYDIIKTEKEITILEEYKINNDIYETQIKINTITREYEITKSFKDSNGNIKTQKKYPLENNSNSFLYLDKKEAISTAQNILDTLKTREVSLKIPDIYQLYLLLNLLPKKHFYPIISEDVLTLSLTSSYDKKYINTACCGNFLIFLNETREAVGQISFYYDNNGGFSYGGNVSYDIKPEFQNNHYATRALNLLKKFITNHKFKGDKDLYIATTIDNTYSQKVAQNNNGELVYNGNVPRNEFIRIIDGIKKVKVYRMKI